MEGTGRLERDFSNRSMGPTLVSMEEVGGASLLRDEELERERAMTSCAVKL